MEKLFLSRLIEELQKTHTYWDVYEKEKYYLLIDEVKKAKNKLKRDLADKYLLMRYDVVIENNVERLVQVNESNALKHYFFVEELYDIIYETHVNLEHAALPQVLKSLQAKYVDIPLQIIKLCLSFCRICSLRKDLMNKSNESKRIIQSASVAQQDNQMPSSSKTPQNFTASNDVVVIDLTDDDDENNNEANSSVLNRKDGNGNYSHCKNKNDKIKKDEEEISKLKEKLQHLDVKNNDVKSKPPSCSVSLSDLASSSNRRLSLSNMSTISDETLSIVSTSSQTNFNESSAASCNPQIPNEPSLSNQPASESQGNAFIIIEDDDEETSICLQWELYKFNMKLVLDDFLKEQRFVDVILSCEDKHIKCHKLILASCSPYFEKIFTENSSHLLNIYLTDLHFWEVKALVDFIYTGEVTVPSSRVGSLLEAAEMLQISGLSEPTDKKAKRTREQCLKFYEKKLNDVNCCHIKKRTNVRNLQNYNKTEVTSKESIGKSEIATQTLSNLNSDARNSTSSFPSKIFESVPKMDTVYTQTYVPVANSNSTHSYLPAPEISRTANESPVSVPSTSNTECSPRRDYNDVNNRDISNNCVKKRKLSNCSQEKNNCKLSQDEMNCSSTTVKSTDSSTAVTRSKCQNNNNNQNDLNFKRMTLIGCRKNFIFTRKKTANMQAIAERTRKKVSESEKKRRRVFN